MSKYHSNKVVIDGLKFDSSKEGKYYLYLKQLEKDGLITDLKLQVPYELIPAVYEEKTIHLKTKDKTVKKLVQRPVYYYADFVYRNLSTGETEVVDTKGFKTKEYRIKSKMMRAFKGITIKEV